ncbi:MAG TPA: helix-turn-helix transcriptional regulator [Amnibacterium sp.]
MDRGEAGRLTVSAQGADRPWPLSARELEVARLVATGATNRQIAAALEIAPKTASAHIEHILRKLGAARRAQIAAWVARR